MDKTLVNHQIVSMRKLVRIAKRHVQQKLFKQINQLKKKIAKFQSDQNDEKSQNVKVQKIVRKLNSKLKSRQNEVSELKPILPDLISKNALSHNLQHFESTIQKSDRVPILNRLVALICMQKTVQSCVEKFKSDNPDCEHWLPVLIELWDEQRKLNNPPLAEKYSKRNKKALKPKLNSKQSTKNKEKIMEPLSGDHSKQSPIKSSKDISSPPPPQNSQNIKKKKSPSKVYTPNFEVTELTSPTSSSVASHRKALQLSPSTPTTFTNESTNVEVATFKSASGASAIIKRLDLNASDPQIPVTTYPIKSQSLQESKRKVIKDDFFINANGNSDEDDDGDQLDRSKWNEPDSNDDEDNEDCEDEQPTSYPIKSNITRLKSSFGTNGTSEPPPRGHQGNKPAHSPQFKPNKHGSNIAMKQSHTTTTTRTEDNLHPSWLAKKAAADKMKNLFSNPIAKRIKFD